MKLVPTERVVEVVEFETEDSALGGKMTITFALADADGGTDLLAVHDGVLPDASPADKRRRLTVVTRETRGARRGGL